MANELAIKVMGDAGDAAGMFTGLKSDADSSFGSVEQASAGLKSALDSDASSAGQSLAGLGQDFKELESDAGSAVDGIKSKMGGLDFASLGGAVGAGAMFAGLEEATTSAGSLQAQLGLTSEEAKEFDAIAKQVYGNNFGESMGDASQTVGQVHQALGLTGDALRSTTEDVFRISDAFAHQGADAQVLTENVRTMKSAFPGKSEAEILDIIANGFQSGAGTAGDFQDTLIEYPRYFADIGLGAEDMSNFIKAGMQAGARNTDILGDAVKEMGILMKDESSEAGVALTSMFGASEAEELRRNFAAGGEAGREAFFDILEGLNQIEDPLERNKVAVQLFGTMGEDLAGSLGDMLPAFLATRDATNEVGDATSLLDAQYAGTIGKLEGFRRQMEMQLIGPLGSVAGPAMEAASGLSGVGATMLGLKGMGVNVTGAFGKMAGVMTGVLNPMKLVTVAQAGLNLVMSANPIALVVLGLVALGAGLVIVYQKSETFRDIVNGAFSAVRDVVMGVLGYFTGSVVPFFTTTLPGAFVGLKDTVLGVFTSIRDFLQPIIDGITLIVTNWTANLKTVWDAFWPLLLAAVQLVWDGIKLYVETVIGTVRTIVETTLGAIKTVWDTLWPPFKTLIDTVWGGIRTAVETYITAVRTVVETVLGTIKSIWESLWGTFRPYIEPIWAAIRTLVETTFGAVRSFIESTLGTIKGVWESIWGAIRTVAETIWGAIRTVIETILGAIVQFVTGDLSGLRDTMAGIWDAISGKTSDIWNGIRDTVSGLVTETKDRVVSAITETRDTLSGLWDSVRGTAEDTWSGIRDRVAALATEAKDRVVGAVTGARDTLSGLWDSVKGKAESAWQGLRDGVAGLAGQARDSVTGIIGEIPGRISGALSGLYGIGQSAMYGLWDGFRSIADSILSWASGFVQSVLDMFSDIPGFSPIEHATASIGERAMLGFGKGMKDHAGGVLGTARGIGTGTVDELMRAARSFVMAESSLMSRSPSLAISHASYADTGSIGMAGAGTGRDGVQVHLNGPVTIHATDRRDAERAMGDVGWGVRSALRRQGRS